MQPTTIVLVARAGYPGAAATLQTLESIALEWPVEADWEVRIIAPHDEALEFALAGLSGDVAVHWDGPGLAEVRREAVAAGRAVVVAVAGDYVRAPQENAHTASIPLIDEQCRGAEGWARSASSAHPEHDGAGLIAWQRDVDPTVKHSLVVFTNTSVGKVHQYRATTKVAWLLESPEVWPETAEFVETHANAFDLVITNDKQLAARLPRAVVVPVGGCWIPPADQLVATKTRHMSMIASGKGFTSGHRLRHQIIPLLQGVDLYGRGLNGVPNLGPVDNKSDALSPYRYSICIENTRTEGYFSEKLIDCLRTGTIPLYWGSPEVLEHFDSRGIITFSSLQDLPRAFAMATAEYYEANLEAVNENFHRAAEWRVVEDRLYNVLRPYVA